ncbi:uncharacterized protein LOC124179208 [Neodiprion fabricii]|uniref:uncharacterized protein LOC124179208 n=1 Tax=Neodiprion fabricii TaxID=2872261 RepID=UPI001ED9620A|nr:uncharacterized protein LOC124179208 [Neodiprion fabricii]
MLREILHVKCGATRRRVEQRHPGNFPISQQRCFFTQMECFTVVCAKFYGQSIERNPMGESHRCSQSGQISIKYDLPGSNLSYHRGSLLGKPTSGGIWILI